MRECGKKKFPSRPGAAHAARMIRERGERMHAYFCAGCRAWHIGH